MSFGPPCLRCGSVEDWLPGKDGEQCRCGWPAATATLHSLTRPAWAESFRIESTPREEGYPDFRAMMTEQPKRQMKDTCDLRYFPRNLPALGTEIKSGTTDDAGTTIRFKGRAFVVEIVEGIDLRGMARVTIEINFAASSPDEPSPGLKIEHPIYSRSGEVAGRVSGVKYPRLETSELSPVERVVKAWTDAGVAPAYHRACQDHLRDEWPSLATAIEALVRES